MNASLLSSTCSKNQLNIWKQQISLPLGGLAFIFNGILLIAISSNKKLRSRSQYRMIVALAFADFCEGLASFIGAVYRLPYYLSDDGCHQYATPLECMVLPHNIIWRRIYISSLSKFSDTGTAFMLAAIAMDRYLAIGFPIFYSINSSRSNVAMVSFVYGISIFCMLFSWIKPIQMQIAGKTLQRVCSTTGLIDPVYTIIIKYATGAASALSALVHLIVAVKNRVFKYQRIVKLNGGLGTLKLESIILRYMGRIERATTIGDSRQELISKKEIKFTLTTMFKGATTILFDSIPRLYGVYAMVQEQLTGDNPQSSGFASFLFAIPNLNSILNVFIYAGGQPDVRKAIFSLVGLGRFVVTSEDQKQSVTVVSRRNAA